MLTAPVFFIYFGLAKQGITALSKMAKSSTSFKPGKSGNPKGRPPKSRAMTEILVAAGKKKASDGDGGNISRNKLLAEMIWKASIGGEVTFHATNREFGGSRTLQLKLPEWIDFVKWLIEQMDGRLSISMKLEDESEPATPSAPSQNGPVFYLPDNGRDPKPDERDESTDNN